MAPADKGEEWILLSTAVARMSELAPIYGSYPGLARRDLETAIRAGRAVIRGWSTGTSANSPAVIIREPVGSRHRLDLIHDSLSERSRGPHDVTLFRQVEVEWIRIATYLRIFAAARAQEQRPARAPTSEEDIPRKTQARRRGRRPKKLDQVKERMRDDIRRGELTVADLRDMLEKQLVGTYGFGRTTVRTARNAVLGEPEFVGK
jgi:hypothetical protein